ncbi:21082_t:CDS:2, partial [Gigaspora margarita]
DIPEELVLSEAETNFSSDSEQSNGEQAVGIDSHRVHQSYTNSPVVNIFDIANASPRQFFERFLLVEYLISTVIPSTNKYIIKYITLTDIPMDNNDPFHLIRKFHNAFNKNLSEAIIPSNFLCIDKSMCQWMANLFLHLDPVEPPEHASKKKFSEYPATIATMLRLTEPWFNSRRTIIVDSWFGSVASSVILYKHSFYSILQLKKHRYWPKNISHDITDALGSDYGLFVYRTGNLNGIKLAVCSIRNRKNIVLLSNCSTTNLKNEVNRYIKNYGNVKFRRPAIFEEFNEYRSAIDILNNLRDNAFSYHNVLSTKHSKNHILAFYLTVAEVNSYSAYCQFVPGKKNMKHINFYKKLVASIFNYYKEEVSTETVASRIKKRKLNPNDTEHDLISIKDDSTTPLPKRKYFQHHCISCHKRTTTACSCSKPRAMCTSCWANYIRTTYSISHTK